jgi:hypothetical protein
LAHLQEVFGEGDTARRRVAINEPYTEDCVPPKSRTSDRSNLRN